MDVAAETNDRGWFERLPKVELHVHLEGAIPHQVLWELLQKYGGDPEIPTLEALADRFVYRDFPHFIEVWTWKNSLLRSYEDFEFLSEHVAKDLARQNIRYAEVFYSPPDFSSAGLEPGRLTEAIRNGLGRAAEIEITLVADLVRDYGPQKAARLLPALREVQGLGVIGIGIGGSEHRFPPEAFASVFRQAREMGFRTSAHAGEAAGPESIWGAIRALRVDRIGHGTRAIEDPQLVDYVAEHKIPLELCVLSNVRTAVVADVGSHPARTYFERGIALSINTDDPKMFGNSLAEEYLALHRHLGFSKTDIQRLIMQAVETSWLGEPQKRRLLGQIQSEFNASESGAVIRDPFDSEASGVCENRQ
jgi:adenosine deaminase